MAKTKIGQMTVHIVAETSKLNRGLKQAKSSLTRFKGVAIGAATAVGAGFMEATRRFEDFNQAMTKSLAIMGDVADYMRDDMVDAAREVARATTFSATQSAEAYFFLASAGLSAAESLKAMKTVANFAQAGNFDLALATDLATDAQSALGLKIDDNIQNQKNLTRVTDVLVKANTLANASVQQFSEALTNKAGAALRLVGKDIEEGVAVLAAYADQGIKGAEAGTALGIVFRDLQTKAIKFSAQFKKAGVAVFDAAGEMRKTSDILRDLEKMLAGASDEQKKLALLTLGFSDKSVAYIQSLLGMSKAVDKYEQSLRKAGNTAEEVAKKSMTAWQRGKAKLGGAAGDWFGAVFGWVPGAAGAVAEKAGLAIDLSKPAPYQSAVRPNPNARGRQMGRADMAALDAKQAKARAAQARQAARIAKGKAMRKAGTEALSRDIFSSVGEGIGSALRGAQRLGGMAKWEALKMQWRAGQFQAQQNLAKGKKKPNTTSTTAVRETPVGELSLARAGTAENYRQKAMISRRNQALKVAMDQRSLLDIIARNTTKFVQEVPAAANI